MKSRISLLVLMLILLGACSSPAQTPVLISQTNTPEPARPSYGATFTPAPTVLVPTVAPTRTLPANVPAGQFDARRAYAQVQMLAQTIGSRVAGSESGYQAGDYIVDQFASFGLKVEKQEFRFEAWEDHGTHVQVIGTGQALEVQAIQYSPAGNVTAELAAVSGQGAPADFAAAKVQGKIALIARGTLPFSDKAENAANAGAVAILIYNNALGMFSGTLRNRVSIPTLAVSGETGQALLNQVARGPVQVKVESDTEVAKKVGRNIIGTRAGNANQVLILGGHYDSVQAGPGANDNGSGVGVLLELARVLSRGASGPTLEFIAFDGEEFGLLGSEYYVQELTPEARGQIRAMLNFDMLAGGSGPLLLGGNGAVSALARKSAVELGIESRMFSLPPNASSDHAPFQGAGIDTVFFSRDYTLLHTPKDTMDQVRADWLEEAGRVGHRLVETLAANP